MFSNFWTLVLLCSIGWVFVALGTLLKIPTIFQILMLIVGLILSLGSLFGLIKQLLRGNK